MILYLAAVHMFEFVLAKTFRYVVATGIEPNYFQKTQTGGYVTETAVVYLVLHKFLIVGH